MEQNLSGKIALVTGSTSGIGLAIAKHLALAGAHVIINGMEDEQAFAAAKALVSDGGRYPVDCYPADLEYPERIAEMIADIEKKFGHLDILVNNAGIQYTARVEAFPKEKWDKIIAVNLSSVFHAIAAALPGMQKRDYGRIINISSAHGLVASAEKAAYVSAKHGVLGLTKVVGLENAKSNITCNAICPAWVRTPLIEAQITAKAKADGLPFEEAAKKLLELKEPSQRFTTVDEVAAMAVFLCSDGANNMTGTAISMDGGWTAQ